MPSPDASLMEGFPCQHSQGRTGPSLDFLLKRVQVEKPSLCNKQLVVSEASAGCYQALGGGDGSWLARSESLSFCEALSLQALDSDTALHLAITLAAVMKALPRVPHSASLT